MKIDGNNLEDIGYSKKAIEIIKNANKGGLTLVMGKTNSGMTACTQSLINSIADGDRKIMSIENPVEVNLQGVNSADLTEKQD